MINCCLISSGLLRLVKKTHPQSFSSKEKEIATLAIPLSFRRGVRGEVHQKYKNSSQILNSFLFFKIFFCCFCIQSLCFSTKFCIVFFVEKNGACIINSPSLFTFIESVFRNDFIIFIGTVYIFWVFRQVW